jgi:phage terminase large subunit GpA-like protein
MSAPISPNSPRPDPSSVEPGPGFGEALVFDGAEDLWRSWRDGLTPDPPLTISQWADRHRVLSARASAEPGRYRTDRTPYMRAIMDALSPSHPARRIVFMKAAQVGASEAGNNWIGYVIHHAPGPMLTVQPTVELAKRFSRQRIEPLIVESPALRERVKPSRARDAGNTVLSKEFPAGLLVITGANSAVGLRSMPARYLFLDEVDAYPPSADEEGDPVALAEARTRTFSWRSKIFLASTPTIHGLSRIEREFEASDQQRFFVPCPHCQHRQWLRFERLRWDKRKPETASYACEACEGAIAEHHKIAMLDTGEWRATAVSRDPATLGFHLSALYSPVGWMSWEMIARMWEAAQANDEAKRSFKNGVLGETWVEIGDAPDWQLLYERRETWQLGTVPSGGLFLTAGADVQKDRIEVSVWAWGRGLASWLVDHVVIEGGPGSTEGWRALAALLEQTWPHAHGVRLGLARLAIDTGYEAASVYSWSRAMGHAQVAPIKGVEGFNRAAPVMGPSYVDVTEGGRKLRRGARLWTVAVATFKTETYRFLRLPRPTDEEQAEGAQFPAGYVHLPRGLEAEWVKQLVAEQLVSVKTRRGFQKLEWQKLRERNEVLDCRVYARAAAWIAGADRWSEEKWRDLEDQVGPPPAAIAPLVEVPVAAGRLVRGPTQGGRRQSTWLTGVDKGWLR